MAELRGEEARHLTRVLRVEPGQLYEISDNREAWLAEVAEAAGQRVVFRVREAVPSKMPPVDVTLCAALVKFDRFEWMVEKATELGVGRIMPVAAARTEKGLAEASRKRSERWERIARESAQQSRRLRVPEILPAVEYEKALVVSAEYRFFLDEAEALPLARVLPSGREGGARAAILLGPEGGWIEGERGKAQAAGWTSVSLSPQILRAETAAAAAIAILVNHWM
jgi:16S rRNA (uracil1498-N3)-methyltransferase